MAAVLPLQMALPLLEFRVARTAPVFSFGEDSLAMVLGFGIHSCVFWHH